MSIDAPAEKIPKDPKDENDRIKELLAHIDSQGVENSSLRERLRKVRPSKIKLANELEETKTKLQKAEATLKQIHDLSR